MDNVWVGHPYFSGFCRFGYFSMNFFLLCGVLRVGAGQLVMRGCCWGGGGVKEIIPGVFNMANTQ